MPVSKFCPFEEIILMYCLFFLNSYRDAQYSINCISSLSFICKATIMIIFALVFPVTQNHKTNISPETTKEVFIFYQRLKIFLAALNKQSSCELLSVLIAIS